MSAPKLSRDYISSAEACRLTGLGLQRFHRLAAELNLRCVRYPGMPPRFHRAEVEKLVELARQGEPLALAEAQ